jgi:hypothetical protein
MLQYPTGARPGQAALQPATKPALPHAEHVHVHSPCYGVVEINLSLLCAEITVSNVFSVAREA